MLYSVDAGAGIDVPTIGDWFLYIGDYNNPIEESRTKLSGIGIDVPTIGDWFHITKANICWRLYPQ